jgi:hypothetical protein
MDFNQRHRRPAEDKSPSAVYRQRQFGPHQDNDIKRQIQNRDEEIFLLSQQTDHLRQRLDQTVESVQRNVGAPPPRAEQPHVAPLRVKEGSRSRSPIRPVRETNPQGGPPGYARDHIAAL